MRTSPRTKSSTLWDNSPANTSLSVPDHPLTGGICPSPSFSQTKFLQPLEQSVRPQAFYGPKTSTHWRKTPAYRPPDVPKPPVTGGIDTLAGLQHLNPSTHWRKTPTDGPPSIQIPPPTGGIFRVLWGGARQQTNDRPTRDGTTATPRPTGPHGNEHRKKTKKNGVSGSPAPGGNPREIRKGPSGNPCTGLDRKVLQTVECGGVLLSHTLSSAVPSPRPGLSFRVRKGTGRLTWAMTTAKPI